jgi:tetratricopeptide (TPR) repeat protein
MKKVACFASMIALAATVATIGAPAQAQRRNRDAAPAQPAQPQPSRAFITAYQVTNRAIEAQNWAAADASIPALRAVASSDYEKFIVAQVEVRIGGGLNDAARQARGVDAMIASNGIPADAAQRIYTIGAGISYNARDYANAVTRARRAIELGDATEETKRLLVSALFQGNMVDEGLTEARAQIAAAQAQGHAAPEAIFSLAAVALQQANRNPELLDILVQRAAAYPGELNFRSAAQVFLDVTGEDRGRSVDAVRLMRAANAMNARAFYAQHVTDLSDDALPNEAVEVIAAARAANFVTRPDPFFDEALTTAQGKIADDRRSLPTSDAAARTRPEARLAVRVADAYLAYGEYARAEELYTLALTKTGADAGLINTRIGISRFRAGNFAGAIEAFNRIEGVRAPLGKLWTALAQTRLTPATAPAAAAPAPAASTGG